MATGLDTEKANSAIKEGYAALERFGSQRARNWTIAIVAIIAFSLWAVWRDGWDLFFQRVVDALNNGFIYAAMALSLVLIYKATGVINFAQGNMAMFGTFIAWVLISDHGLPDLAGDRRGHAAVRRSAAPAIERIFIRPFDPSNHLAITIVTLAWFIILGALATVIWGADPYAFDTPFPRNSHFDFGGARFFYENLGVWVMVLGGAAPREPAAAQDQGRARLPLGVVQSRVEQAGRHPHRAHDPVRLGPGRRRRHAGRLPDRPQDVPRRRASWGRVLIYSFAAATLGGLDSLPGAVVGGLLIGLAETMIGGYIDPIGSDLALGGALLVIVVVLFVKPTGLFGSRKPERV